MRRILLAGLAAISMAACSTIAKAIIEKPKVDLKSVQLRKADDSAATLMLAVQVDNPNSFAIKVDRLRYQVELGGRAFTSGTLENAAEVAAKGTSLVEIPVTVKYSDVLATMIDLWKNRTSKYRVKGDAAVGILEIPFDEQGELKLE